MIPDIDIARYHRHRELAERLVRARQDYEYWQRHAGERPNITSIDRFRTRITRHQTRAEFLAPYLKAHLRAELEYKADLFDADQVRRTSWQTMERAQLQYKDWLKNGQPVTSSWRFYA